MRLSPLDIKKQEFAQKLRGYDPDEVQAFLDMVAMQWDELLAEQRRGEEKVVELKAKLEHYERVEEALQEALQTARESARHALDNAQQEAALLIKEAEGKAEDVLREARHDRERLAQEAEALEGRRDQLVARLRAFLTAEVELLDHYQRSPQLTPAPRPAAARPAAPDVPGKATGAAPPPPRDAAPAPDIPPLAPEELDDVLAGDVPEAAMEAMPEAAPEAGTEASPEPAPEAIPEAASEAGTPDDREPLSFRFFEPYETAPLPPADGPRGPIERAAARQADASWIVRPAVAVAHAQPKADEGGSEDLDKIRRILNDL